MEKDHCKLYQASIYLRSTFLKIIKCQNSVKRRIDLSELDNTTDAFHFCCKCLLFSRHLISRAALPRWFRVWAGNYTIQAFQLTGQADRVDGVASRQIRFARSLKFVYLAAQSLSCFLEMRDFSLFSLQSVGKVMGAVDQRALGIA
jgi:hypothetical protein